MVFVDLGQQQATSEQTFPQIYSSDLLLSANLLHTKFQLFLPSWNNAFKTATNPGVSIYGNCRIHSLKGLDSEQP